MSYFVIALLRRVMRTEHPTSGKIILEIYIISFQQQWTLVQKIQKILHCTHCPKNNLILRTKTDPVTFGADA